MADNDISSGSNLLKYTLLAKSAKGKACVAVIQQVLQNPNTYVFGELLEQPNVKALAEGENKPWYEALTLFAYGTYRQYKDNSKNYPELAEPLIKKLRQLTVVSIASVQKSIPYPTLLQELGLEQVRDLEDLIIDCVYAGIIKGKLDQHEQRFQVDWAIGRDIRPGQVEDMVKVLSAWCDRSELLMKKITEKIQLASFLHEQHATNQKEFEGRVEEIKGNLKAAMEADMAFDFEGGVVGAFAEGGLAANKKGGRKGGPGGGGDRRRR